MRNVLFALLFCMNVRFSHGSCSKSIPAHAEIRMKILGPFLSVEDPDTLFLCVASRISLRASR
jgi:hypothetical protein